MTALGCSSYYQPRAQGTRLVTINITRRFFYLMHCHASQRRLIVNRAHWVTIHLVTIHLVIIGSCVSGLPVIIRGSFDQHTSLFQGCLDESGTRPRLNCTDKLIRFYIARFKWSVGISLEPSMLALHDMQSLAYRTVCCSTGVANVQQVFDLCT